MLDTRVIIMPHASDIDRLISAALLRLRMRAPFFATLAKSLDAFPFGEAVRLLES